MATRKQMEGALPVSTGHGLPHCKRGVMGGVRFRMTDFREGWRFIR
ncbi:MAG: hypothetical protein MUF01_07450 [Bryobacterales bacterium]|jgi:hypothetical protein|nr:hypothetical protein [Bryobacterales bacterium]